MINEEIGEIDVQWMQFQMNGGHRFQLHLMIFEESTSIRSVIRLHLGDIVTKHRWNDQRRITRND